MKYLLHIIFLAFLLVAFGCSNGKGKETLETAQFEEKQNNREHAIKLYEEVVRKYPGTANAKTAQERLNVLKGGN